MSLLWKELRIALNREIESIEARKIFAGIRESDPVLKDFQDPKALVNWLLDHDRHPMLEEDRALKILRDLCLDKSEKAGIWQSILLLGLWPMAEWVYHKIRDASEDEEVISAFWGGFNAALDKDDLWSQTGVAKRWMYFLWKRARANIREVELEHGKLAQVHAHLAAGAPKRQDASDPEPEIMETWPEFRSKSDEEAGFASDELYTIHSQLTGVLRLSEAEADLVVRHFVLGESFSDIASTLNITPAACRQRCSRIIKRLRALPVRVRRTLVTHSNLNGMEGKKGDFSNDDEGEDSCPKHWMN